MLVFYLSLIDDEENQNKFKMIYEKYGNSMLYTAIDILKDDYLAEDAVQEAFLQIAKNIKTIRTDTSAETKAYVVTIVRNCSYRMAQKNSKYIIMPEDNIIEETVADKTDYESRTVSIVMYEEMKKALATLDEKYVTPLVLQEQGYKISEIADSLNISQSAVKMRISRAKKMIYELLEAKK
ncbi:MAG: RNA polymerase sigma factor [Oscillospiraceae bacterium]|nr:RNA polymerase sigma factor [Oscillospiraceae bacterium]